MKHFFLNKMYIFLKIFHLSCRLTFGTQGLLLLVFHLLCAANFNQSTPLLPESVPPVYFVGSTGNHE